LKSTVKLRAGRLLVSGLACLVASGCGLLGAPSAPPPSTPAPSPTLLPAPKPLLSPEPGAAASPPAPASPVSAAPTVPPTRIPPPNLSPAGPSGGGSGERARVVNTEGQGANMRAEPSPDAALVRTIREGTELELIGAEREGGGRRWRNVRDPASGASGWIVTDLLDPIPSAPPPAAPASEPKPSGAPKPSGSPAPAASPPSAAAPDSAAKPSTRIGDADRAYLAVLQPQVDALGKAISSANEQIERAGGRPEILSDPAWRRDTEAAAVAFADVAAAIRGASPGPSTGTVHRYASNAADRAEESADGLSAALESKDARSLSNVRTTLVRLIGEMNNMNLSLLDLQ